jgi:hypothetical protein
VVDQHNVVIEQGDTKIIVPKDIYEAKQQVERSSRFTDSMGRTFHAIGRDSRIEGFGLTTDAREEPSLTIPRETLQSVEAVPLDDRNEREIVQHAELQILRAILDRTTRRWEFVWQGMNISAPVLDDAFYQDFYDHRITIAPGDSLECDLKMYQRKSGPAGVFMNYKYEVISVTKHVPRIQTGKLF